MTGKKNQFFDSPLHTVHFAIAKRSTPSSIHPFNFFVLWDVTGTKVHRNRDERISIGLSDTLEQALHGT